MLTLLLIISIVIGVTASPIAGALAPIIAVLGVHFAPKKIKLLVIRAEFLVLSSIMIKLGIKASPLTWLRHYVVGSGKAMEDAASAVQAASSALRAAIIGAWDNYNEEAPDLIRTFGTVYGNKYCVYHSTLYDGSGFDGRPDLFYLLGGFTFLLRRDGLVSGKDRYDWHPNGYHISDNGEKTPLYFSSPFGGEKLVPVYKALNLLFGNDWFSNNNLTRVYGIPNKLWDDMALVGAKAFNSWFDKIKVEGLVDLEVELTVKSGENFDGQEVKRVANLELATLENAGFYFYSSPAYKDKFGVYYDMYGEVVDAEEYPRKWDYDREDFERLYGLNRPQKERRERGSRSRGRGRR